MNATDHAMTMLARLNADDRRWIVERLSEEARTRLTALEPVPSPAPPEPAVSAAESDEAHTLEWIAGADPARMAEVLQAEPSWVICSVLRAGAWPWSKAFLKELPPSIRVDVARLERQNVRLAGASRAALLRVLAERVGPPAQTQPAEASPRFDTLLDRFRKTRRA